MNSKLWKKIGLTAAFLYGVAFIFGALFALVNGTIDPHGQVPGWFMVYATVILGGFFLAILLAAVVGLVIGGIALIQYWKK